MSFFTKKQQCTMYTKLKHTRSQNWEIGGEIASLPSHPSRIDDVLYYVRHLMNGWDLLMILAHSQLVCNAIKQNESELK